MTLQTSGPISFSDASSAVGQSSSYSMSLSFLNSQIKPSLRPNIGAGAAQSFTQIYGYNFFQNNTEGNCNNSGASNCACNCGNNNCSASNNCTNINCTNCDSTSYLQPNCNCACTYNCVSNQNCFSSACNCSKIICTHLHSIGQLPTDIFQADQEFGTMIKERNPLLYFGYVAWAEVVVDWMNGGGPQVAIWIRDPAERSRAQIQWSTSWARHIATPWAEEMAFRMGRREKGNPIGVAMMAMGGPISYLVGAWNKVFGPSTKPAGLGKGYMLVAVFVVLKSVVMTGNAITRVAQFFKSIKSKFVRKTA